ncbi:MAG: hypothetical protein WCH78_09990 [Bacteroidota bacterium]
MKHRIGLFFFLFFTKFCLAQDELPEFKIKQIVPGKVTISWHNPFHNCRQLFVQRSADNKKFKTIISAKNPGLFENSFTDTKLPLNKTVYYRIQYTLKGGNTYFSKSHPLPDKTLIENNASVPSSPNWKASHFVFTNKNGNIQILLNNPSEHNYRLVFQDEKRVELFQMKNILSDNLVLDNANFTHKGWFYFELYQDEILIDKNKVFLKGDSH